MKLVVPAERGIWYFGSNAKGILVDASPRSLVKIQKDSRRIPGTVDIYLLNRGRGGLGMVSQNPRARGFGLDMGVGEWFSGAGDVRLDRFLLPLLLR